MNTSFIEYPRKYQKSRELIRRKFRIEAMEVHVREVPTSRSVYLVRSFEGFASLRDYRFYIGNKVRPRVWIPCPAQIILNSLRNSVKAGVCT